MILGISFEAWSVAAIALIAIGVSLVKLGLKIKDKQKVESEDITDIIHDVVDVVTDLKEDYEDNKEPVKKN